VNRFCTYPLKQDVPLSSNLVLFPDGVAIFYSVVEVPHLVVPVTLKAAQFYVSTLQLVCQRGQDLAGRQST